MGDELDGPCPRCGTIFDHMPAPGANTITCPKCGLTATVAMISAEAPAGFGDSAPSTPTELPPEMMMRMLERGNDVLRRCDFTLYTLHGWQEPTLVSAIGGRPSRVEHVCLLHRGPDLSKRVEVDTRVDGMPPEVSITGLLMNMWDEPGAQTDALREALQQMDSLDPWTEVDLSVDGVGRPAHYFESGASWRAICQLGETTVTVASTWLSLDEVALVSVSEPVSLIG